jgi:hypothetical protein
MAHLLAAKCSTNGIHAQGGVGRLDECAQTGGRGEEEDDEEDE